MKYSIALTAATLVSNAAAFPAIAEAIARGDIKPKQNLQLEARQGVPDPTKTFNAKAQYVSTSGDHKFVAPQGDDQRGPCPGLNAMANHVSCAPINQ